MHCWLWMPVSFQTSYDEGRSFYFYKIIGSPVRRTIQLLGALAFVPEGDVYDVYHKIKPELSDDVGEFFEYIESTWISSPGSPAKYLPSEYNGTSIPTA